jgi:hypothetical protein
MKLLVLAIVLKIYQEIILQDPNMQSSPIEEEKAEMEENAEMTFSTNKPPEQDDSLTLQREETKVQYDNQDSLLLEKEPNSSVSQKEEKS